VGSLAGWFSEITLPGIDAGEVAFLAELAHQHHAPSLESTCIHSNGSRGGGAVCQLQAAGGSAVPNWPQRGRLRPAVRPCRARGAEA